MAGVAVHGATFSFAVSGSSYSAIVTGLSVDSPSAEIVDMTSMDDGAGLCVLVPTGGIASGAAGVVTIDYLSSGSGGVDWQSVVKASGTLTLASSNHTVARRVILENATAEARVGELVRGTLRFRMTDYSG